MAVIIGSIGQKGGTGKSTCARLIAREYANAGWNVKIADTDIQQGTSYDWHQRRLAKGLMPEIAVEKFGSVEQAIRVAASYDLMVIDGAPHADANTLKIVKASVVAMLPCGLSIEDRKPQVQLAHDLVNKGVDKRKLVFVMCRVGDSDALQEEARSYIKDAGYRVLEGSIPEKVGYLRSAQEGRSLTETPFATLNHRAEEVAQGIINLVTRYAKGMAA